MQLLIYVIIFYKGSNNMSKFVDSIIGHAVGDAMGVPTEFFSRERLLEHPVLQMISSSKTGQDAGSWSDDTSMEISTIDSFIQNGKLSWINGKNGL